MQIDLFCRQVVAAICLQVAAIGAWSADQFRVTAVNDLSVARPAETIVIPFSEVTARLPNVVFDQIIVRDPKGNIVPSQVTSFVHSHKGPQTYDQLIFQHDFAAKEKSATFTVEASAKAIAPYATKVFARFVPERYDDFAWENDRIAHRAYGPALELAAAGKDQMTSSGIDLWTKTVRYPIVDHWYHKGHDGLHTNTGEGLDMYEVGLNRGAGGTGIWNGKQLFTSKNWRTWKILANGPIRAVFELGYEPWDAGNGVQVAETKRFTIDAGHNLDDVESTFTFISPTGADTTLNVAIGLSQHTTLADVNVTRNQAQRSISLWEKYKDSVDGALGTAVIVAPNAAFLGFAELPANPDVARLVRPDLLILSAVRSGTPVRYLVGGGWDKSGDFKTQPEWNNYLAAQAARLASPIHITFPENK